MKSLGDQIREYAKENKQDVRFIVETVNLNISKDIVNNSPVDEGRFRSNWIGTKGVPSTRQLRSLKRDPMRSAKIAIEKAIFGGWGVYYFVNNLPYAKAIEFGLYKKNPVIGTKDRKTGRYEIRTQNGYSKQARNGLIRVAIKRQKRSFNKLLKTDRLANKL